MTDQNDTIRKAIALIDLINKHLDEEHCQHDIHAILGEVTE